jgi:hypothetical protein
VARGEFHLKTGNRDGPAEIIVRYGPQNQGWQPLAGDWDGDGVDTIGAYDPVTGRFLLRNSNDQGNADIILRFGPTDSTWTAIAGDWNADGIDSPGLHNPATNTFHLTDKLIQGPADNQFMLWGAPTGLQPLVLRR